MANEINLGTFCFAGRYFTAALSMQDDEGNVIPCSPDMQTDSMLKLYQAAIAEMLKVHESNSTLKTPEYIDDDGVKFTEGFKDHPSVDLQNRWDTHFALESDRVRFDKLAIGKLNEIRAQVIFKPPKSYDALDKLVLRYVKDGRPHNYRALRERCARIAQFRHSLDMNLSN